MIPKNSKNRAMIRHVETKTFVSWLLAEMEKRGWTQADLARRGNIPTGVLSRIINSQRGPGASTCIKIATAFNIPPQEVFRMAGILPKSLTDELENNLSFRQVYNLMKGLSPEEQQNLIAYAEFLLEQAKRK